MLRREAFMTKEAPEQEPRNRQAVTQTYNTSTIALIRQNAASSPLLSLPPEVRECILMHLLGDKLIHIRFLTAYEEEDFNDVRGLTKKHSEKQGSFRHTVCSRIITFDAEEEALGDNSRHEDCTIYDDSGYYGKDTIVLRASAHHCIKGALAVLSVCRQLYEESNFILWSTNTFSFNRWTCLWEFMKSLNRAQKRNLKKLHLIANSKVSGYLCDEWLKRCSFRSLRILRGLESLSLCIEHLSWQSPAKRSATFTEEAYDEFWNEYMESVGLGSLRVLRIKYLNLSITDYKPRKIMNNLTVHHLPAKVKAKCIEELREKLLDPQGAKVQKALDAEANKIRQAEKVRYRELSEVRKLRAAENEVEVLRPMLKEFEEQAARLQHDADQALDILNNLQPGDSMLQQYQKVEAEAQEARAAVDEYAGKLQLWEGRLDRRQKLAAAKAEMAAKLAKTADAAQATDSD